MREVYSLQIGEETGKLTEVLQDLARFYQNKIKQRRKNVSSLTYPCVVLSPLFYTVCEYAHSQSEQDYKVIPRI